MIIEQVFYIQVHMEGDETNHMELFNFHKGFYWHAMLIEMLLVPSERERGRQNTEDIPRRETIGK